MPSRWRSRSSWPPPCSAGRSRAAGGPATKGIAVGAIGLLSVAAFWSGLPYVLGPAAVVLGLLGRARSDQRTPATVAVVLGALTTAAAIAAVVLDQTM